MRETETMSKQTRKANRAARNVIKFTRNTWNPAQVEAWRGGYGSAEADRFAEVVSTRFELIVAAIPQGVAPGSLRRKLRAIEVKG